MMSFPWHDILVVYVSYWCRSGSCLRSLIVCETIHFTRLVMDNKDNISPFWPIVYLYSQQEFWFKILLLHLKPIKIWEMHPYSLWTVLKVNKLGFSVACVWLCNSSILFLTMWNIHCAEFMYLLLVFISCCIGLGVYSVCPGGWLIIEHIITLAAM